MTLDLSALPRRTLGALERSAQGEDDQSTGQTCTCTRDEGIWGSEGIIPRILNLNTTRR